MNVTSPPRSRRRPSTAAPRSRRSDRGDPFLDPRVVADARHFLQGAQEQATVVGRQHGQPTLLAALDALLHRVLHLATRFGNGQKPNPSIVGVGSALDVSLGLQLVESRDDARPSAPMASASAACVRIGESSRASSTLSPTSTGRALSAQEAPRQSTHESAEPTSPRGRGRLALDGMDEY